MTLSEPRWEPDVYKLAKKIGLEAKLASLKENPHLEAEMNAVGAQHFVAIDWTDMGGSWVVTVTQEDGLLMGLRRTKGTGVAEIRAWLACIAARPNVDVAVVVIDNVPPSGSRAAGVRT